MKRKIFIGLLTVFVWTTGIFFGTTSFPPKIVHSAHTGTPTQIERKNENRLIAKRYASVGFGWRGKEWKCLESLWTHESRFDNFAKNPKSSARGIAQLLREQSSEPRIQVLRGLNYISTRYTSPCRAYRFSQRHNWY